jgi:hypothetical protein
MVLGSNRLDVGQRDGRTTDRRMVAGYHLTALHGTYAGM